MFGRNLQMLSKPTNTRIFQYGKEGSLFERFAAEWNYHKNASFDEYAMTALLPSECKAVRR